jgi:hypothetical protein
MKTLEEKIQYRKEYYKKNRQKRIQYQLEYHKKNRLKYSQYQHFYYLHHRQNLIHYQNNIYKKLKGSNLYINVYSDEDNDINNNDLPFINGVDGEK